MGDIRRLVDTHVFRRSSHTSTFWYNEINAQFSAVSFVKARRAAKPSSNRSLSVHQRATTTHLQALSEVSGTASHLCALYPSKHEIFEPCV